MFTRVLLPLDGSARAERAIPTAVHIVRASGGTLILAHVCCLDYYFYLAGVPLAMQDLIEQDIKDGEAYLTRIARLPELQDIAVEQMVMYGPVASRLLAISASKAADLVVLTSHGRTGFTRWALGSIAEQVAKSSPVPVLILRQGGPLPISSHPEAMRPLRALVPLDGSVYAKAALEPAAQLVAALATPKHGAIHLLRVARPSAPAVLKREEYYSDDWWYEHLLHKAKGYLYSLADHIQNGLIAPTISRCKLTVTWSVSVDADVAHAIVRVAENGEDAEGAGAFGGCRLIVMATHGKSGLSRLMMGNITERVLHSTKLPVLVVRPVEIADQEEHTRQREIVIG